jgi:DNA-binding transcriptional regulator LsrR (DeoR family)
MKEKSHREDHTSLLADIAEMYFLEGKNQNEISQKVGMTRSNVSRLLKEARQTGIVSIQINRPIHENFALADKMVERFDLKTAHIVEVDHLNDLLNKLGKVAADELKSYLKPGIILGTAWGTAISATVEQLEVENRIPEVKVVQLLGALGSRIRGYDGHGILRRLEQKLDAVGIYLNAPYLVDDVQTARLLLENPSVKETLDYGKKADLALLGVGSLDLTNCSYYLAGYVSREEILKIQKFGAIGDVCGRFFNLDGEVIKNEYQNRLIGLPIEDLEKIPVRIGVAGGLGKIDPILGALRGKLINILITDSMTASEVLNRAGNNV